MVRIIITGGTIDKQYDEINGHLVFTRTLIPDMLEQGLCTMPVTLQQAMLKDSLEMSDEDREVICKACEAATEGKIIITHGTDTMVQTAGYIAARIQHKTVVLLGAMVPYSFGNSDALFNLGCAMAAVQTLDAGVYITMNGQLFNWDNVQKNKNLGCFQAL